MADFSYQYNDWITLEGSERLTRLRLHIQEVSDLMLPDSSGSDHSVSNRSLQAYLDKLTEKEEKLSDEVAQRNRNPFQRVRRSRK